MGIFWCQRSCEPKLAQSQCMMGSLLPYKLIVSYGQLSGKKTKPDFGDPQVPDWASFLFGCDPGKVLWHLKASDRSYRMEITRFRATRRLEGNHRCGQSPRGGHYTEPGPSRRVYFLTFPEQCRQTSFSEAYLTPPPNTAVQGLHVWVRVHSLAWV